MSSTTSSGNSSSNNQPFPSIPSDGWVTLPNTFAQCLSGFNCFGCSACNHSGLRLQMSVHESQPYFQCVFLPTHRHSGFPTLMMGALQGVMFDCLCEWIVMSCFNNIGFTTKFILNHRKGVPALSVKDSEKFDAAGGTAKSPVELTNGSVTNLHPLAVRAIGRVSRHSSNRVELDFQLLSLSATTIYATALIEMILPSQNQIQRMFRGDNTKIQALKQSVTTLPRPNPQIAALAEATEKQISASSTATNSNSTRPRVPSSAPSKSSSSAATPASSSKQIQSPSITLFAPHTTSASAELDIWVPLNDPMSNNIPNYNCFGCSSHNKIGYRCSYEVNVRTRALRCFVSPRAEWGGFPSMLHGGNALVPIDCLSCHAAVLEGQSLALTSCMNTRYLESAPVPLEEGEQQHPKSALCLLVQGEVLSRKGRSVTVLTNLYDVTGTMYADPNRFRFDSVKDVTKKPRLCVTSEVSFTLATEANWRNLIGEGFMEGIAKAEATTRNNVQELDMKRSLLDQRVARLYCGTDHDIFDDHYSQSTPSFLLVDQYFRQHQTSYAATHRSPDPTAPQHASHIIGVATAQQLAISSDHPSNYRMQTPFTNQSVHERIDHRFLNGGNDGRGFTYQSQGSTQYVSPQQQVERLQRQIDHLRNTGDIHNPTNMTYLRSNAETLNMDMRTFNNVSTRASDLTHYRGVGRPRDSDYTAGGNLRRLG